MLNVAQLSERLRSSLGRRAYWWAADPPSPPCHVVLEPVVESGAVHTRLFFILSRIVQKFRVAGVPPPLAIDLTFTLYDSSGREVSRSTRPRQLLEELLVWESRAEVPSEARPFEGTIAVTSVLVDGLGRQVAEAIIDTVWGHKFAGIVDFFIDYYEDGKFITTTHANIAVRTLPSPGRRALVRMMGALVRTGLLDRWRSPVRIRPGAVAVFDDESVESHLIYYAWLMPIWPREIAAELRNVDGMSLRTSLRPLGRRSFARLRLSELFPSARAFLRGQPGHLLLDGVSPLLNCNPRFYVGAVQRAQGNLGVDHSYVEYRSSPSLISRSVWQKAGKGLHSPCVVIDRDSVRTALVVFNMVDIEAPKRVGVLIYDRDGRLVVRKDDAAKVPARGLRVLQIRELLEKAGWSGDFLGHAEVFYSMDGEWMPSMLHHQVLYVQPTGVEAVQLMVGLWNSPRSGRPSGIDDPQPRGDWPICAPAYLDGEYSTHLGLTNCSHAWDYDVEAIVAITLRVAGDVKATREVRIPAHGTWYGAVVELFPGMESVLASCGMGLVVVDPRNVATLGAQFFHLQSASGHFSSEHTL